MEPYNAEFRGEVLAACDTKEERRAIALRFKVSESWLRRIQQQRRETGQVAAKKAAPRQPKWHAWADWLVAKIAADRAGIREWARQWRIGDHGSVTPCEKPPAGGIRHRAIIRRHWSQ